MCMCVDACFNEKKLWNNKLWNQIQILQNQSQEIIEMQSNLDVQAKKRLNKQTKSPSIVQKVCMFWQINLHQRKSTVHSTTIRI